MGQFLFVIIWWALQLLIYAIIASAVMSWLLYFNVINDRHPFVRQLERFLWAVTRPVLRPIQKVIPPIGGFDITPIIAILVIGAAQQFLLPWAFTPIIGALHG